MVKVFVVEDSVLLRRDIVMTTPWNELGCEVIGDSGNGQAALQMIEQLIPDIVITDIRLPGMDGLQLIEMLKEKLDVEFIIISGYSEFEYALKAIKLGVNNYILKPISDEEFYKTIKATTEKVSEKQQLYKYQGRIEEIVNINSIKFEEAFTCKNINSKSSYIVKAIEYIMNNYMKDISINDVAKALFISNSYLTKLFKKELNATFNEYLTYYRVKKAIEIMKNENLKVYEVAEMVGYKDYRYFGMVFKKLVGVLPKDFHVK